MLLNKTMCLNCPLPCVNVCSRARTRGWHAQLPRAWFTARLAYAALYKRNYWASGKSEPWSAGEEAHEAEGVDAHV